MTYTDLTFLFVFLPLTILIYNIFPKKHRGKVLLIASYIFFYSISKKLIIYLLIATLITYIAGLLMNKMQENRDAKLKQAEKEEKKLIKEKCLKHKRIIFALAILILLGILIVLKYSEFLGTNINKLLTSLNIENLEIMKFALPIGISFYTLQTISYIMDVHREKIKADKNIGRVALYLAFFPQIMEGPITRYEETADKLWSGERTTYRNLTFGAQRILYGLMKKIIIADRLNVVVEEVFNNYSNYSGGIIAVGMVLYTLQLYMDFSGVMDMCCGIGEIFGVKMPENFKRPFFSKSIAEFWTRWHITLGTWLKDYVYYPISMSNINKKLTTKLRKKIGNYYGPLITSSIALFAVWICNGIWHGSAWNYIFFGLYHFAFILLGRICMPLTKKINEKLKIDSKKMWYKIMQIVRTTILVFFGELFFRANGLQAGFNMFKQIFTNFSFSQFSNNALLKLGLDFKDYVIVFIVLIVVVLISILNEKGINVREKISEKNIVIRWSIYFTLIFAVIIFGAYGVGYIPVSPMYAQF